MRKAIASKHEKPSNQERQALRQFLRDKGIPANRLRDFLEATDDGKDRKQIAEAIIARCKQLPKKQA